MSTSRIAMTAKLTTVLFFLLLAVLFCDSGALFEGVTRKMRASLAFSKKVVATLPIVLSCALPARPSRAMETSRSAVAPIASPGLLVKKNPLQRRFPFDKPSSPPSSSSTSPGRAESSPLGQKSHFVRNAVQAVGQSVVRIDCEREVSQLMSLFSDHFREGEVIRVAGTGIVASSDGYILTNAHVVEQAKKLTITFSNGRSFKAELVASDEFTDLAVIRADLSKEKDFQLQKAPMGDSGSLQAGDWVIAVGCPVGLDFTVTLGVVSSPKRSALEVGAPYLKGSYIQTDAALNSGNSGGPLVNDAGEVVGINTMVRTNSEAIGFAIPINRARSIYEVLRTGKKPSHAYFGVEISSLTPDNARINNEDPNAARLPEAHGALITKVIPGSPADSFGLRKHDVIVEVNGEVIRGVDEAETWLDQCKPGRGSLIKVLRGENAAVVHLEPVPQDLHTLMEERKKQQQSVFVIKPGQNK
eukprot:gene7899-8714_t